MATYVVYSYQFSPVFKDSPSLFPEDNLSYQEAWDNKQKHFGDLFNDDISFRYRNALFSHEVLFNNGGIIVIKIANNKVIVQESGFVAKKLQHNPSCRILIDNRKDVQNLYIEQNDYSFSSTDVVKHILEKSLNVYLKANGLSISIQHRYLVSEFWDIVDSAALGVRMVRFCMQYPNLPSVRAKIDDMLTETSRELHSKETKIEFNAGEGEKLQLTKENEKIKDLVEVRQVQGIVSI